MYTATHPIYPYVHTLSLPDALPISGASQVSDALQKTASFIYAEKRPPLHCLWHSFRFSYPRLKAIQITLFEERCLGGTLQPFNRPWMIRSQPRLSLVRIMDNSRIANGPFYIFFF